MQVYMLLHSPAKHSLILMLVNLSAQWQSVEMLRAQATIFFSIMWYTVHPSYSGSPWLGCMDCDHVISESC